MNRTVPKTSTFTLCHDRCKPEAWTVHDIMAFSDFIKTGSMAYAERLASLGVTLVRSEHHVPAGGELEVIGWAKPGQWVEGVYTDLDEMILNAEDQGVTPACRIFSGKIEYVAAIPFADGPPPDGCFSHYEYEVFGTREEAEKRHQDSFEGAM